MCETGDREEEEVENVSVNLSGQQLINEVLEMFYCMNTQAHTHMLAIFVVLRVCVCVSHLQWCQSDSSLFLWEFANHLINFLSGKGKAREA